MTVSALEQSGLEKAWAEICALMQWRRESGHWALRRAAQARHWFYEELRQTLLARLDTPAAKARTGRTVPFGRNRANNPTARPPQFCWRSSGPN
jgi:LAO/AO transport system kinase